MSDPITKEERNICQRFVDHCAPTIAPKASYDWLRGYEALALDLESVLDKTRMWAVVCQNSEKHEKEKCADMEQKIEDKSLKILALTEKIMNAEEASLVKILQLERRLKIAEAQHPLIGYLMRQWPWSKRTFGPGKRTNGIIEHITKELREIEAKPDDLSEWIDVMILAMDGYWRHGGEPGNLMLELLKKQDKNFNRTWPNPTSEDKAIEHDRSSETLAMKDEQ